MDANPLDVAIHSPGQVSGPDGSLIVQYMVPHNAHDTAHPTAEAASTPHADSQVRSTEGGESPGILFDDFVDMIELAQSFDKAHKADLRATRLPNYRLIFDSYDVLGSGQISLAALRTALERVKKSSSSRDQANMGSITASVCGYIARLGSRLAVWRDGGNKAPVEVPHLILLSFFGSFCSILILSYIDYVMIKDKSDLVMIVGSFGAQAVLVFAVPNAPLAQPWNCIFGNTLSAFVGVSCYKAFNHFATDFDDIMFVASAFAVALAIVGMLLTKSVHPPAGATALIAVVGSARVHDLGYMYLAFPIFLGSFMQVFIGILLNNLSTRASRSYPMVWLPIANPIAVAAPPAIKPVPLEDPDKVVISDSTIISRVDADKSVNDAKVSDQPHDIEEGDGL